MRAEAKKLPPFLLHFQKLSLYLHRSPFETGDEMFANPCRIGLFYGPAPAMRYSTDPRVER